MAMKYGTFMVAENQIAIKEIAPHAAIRLKNVFPKIATYKRPPIILSMTDETAEDFEWFLKRYPMQCDTSSLDCLKEAAKNSRDKSDHIEQILQGQKRAKPVELKGAKLRDYQAKAVRMLLSGKRGLIGDDVGLGKTFVALGLFTDPTTRPGLVVVQTHLIQQWIEHVKERLGLDVKKIRTTNPKKEKLKPADVYVTSYHRIAGWVDPLCSGMINSVVFDECQDLRRCQSDRYHAAKNISKSVEYVLGLSATPIYNYGIEMFNVMDCIAPGSLGTRDEFLREWCFEGDFHGKVKHPKALGSYLRDSHFFLRRTREEVSRELPQINKIVHQVPYDDEEEQKVMDLAIQLARTAIQGSFTERGHAARQFDLMLRMATGVGKAKFVAEYVRILLENDESVLLIGWHRNVYEIWLNNLKDFDPVMYTGSESANQKEETKRKFLDLESKLMIMSLRSGVGLDGIQKVCSTVVFGELDWSPQVHEQVTGRLQRDGQERQVTAIYLVGDGGSDPPMVDLLGLKNQQAKGIVDPEKKPENQHSDSSRIQEMAKKFLKTKGQEVPNDTR